MEIQSIETQVVPVLTQATDLVVRTQGDLEAANHVIGNVKKLRKEITDTFNPMKKKAQDAHKEIVAQEKRFLEPLDMAEGTIKNKISKYLVEQDTQRKLEETRLAELARKERDAALARANKRIDALMDKASDAMQQIGILRAEMDRPDLSDEEKTIIQSKVNALAAKVDAAQEQAVEKAAQAQAIAQTPEPIPAVQNVTKIAGMTIKREKSVEVVNALAVIQAVATGRLPPSVVEFNISQLKKLANAGMMLPGCKITEVINTGHRAVR